MHKQVKSIYGRKIIVATFTLNFPRLALLKNNKSELFEALKKEKRKNDLALLEAALSIRIRFDQDKPIKRRERKVTGLC